MNKALLFLILGFLGSASTSEATDRFFIFKASATITVDSVVVGTNVDRIVTKTLKGNDLINLTLAQPLGTKVDAQTAVLAVAVVIEGPGTVAAPKSRLVIFNPDPNVTGAAKLVTIATLSDLDFDVATLTNGHTGQGIAKVNFAETTIGVDPTNNKFFAATLQGSGQATAPIPVVSTDIDGFTFALKSLSGEMHIKFKLATKPADPAIEIQGNVIKGMLKTTKTPITFVDL